MYTTHYSVQTVSAQFAVRMRQLDRHLGLKRTETPLGQTSLEQSLICRMIGLTYKVPGNKCSLLI